ncbi:hypothetical protein PMAYCL1PPCAC_26241, partial [Pristionchus mayeri]
SILYENRLIQYFLSLLIWIFSIIGAGGYCVGKCERQIFNDGTFMDKCHRSLRRNSTFPKYANNPGLYDAAHIIRDVMLLDVMIFCPFSLSVCISYLLLLS